MKSYYEILGLKSSASDQEIKSAYKKLARKFHPDRGGDTKKFQEIQQAYSVIGDAKKRHQYDNPNLNHRNLNDADPGDIFDIFGFRTSRGPQKRRGAFTATLWITLEDIARNEKRFVSLKDILSTNINMSLETSTVNDYVEIDIPPAIDDNQSVRYPNLILNKQDLIINFRIKPDNKWSRNGLDILTEKTVEIWDLILGSTVVVDTISGSQVKITIPAGTQPSSLMRVGKHGLEDRSKRQGDMYVKILARIPKNIPEPLIKTIREHRNNNT